MGVVNDAGYRTVRIGVVPTMYLPMAQVNRLRWGFSLTAKVMADRPSIERSLTEALSRTDPRLACSFRDYADLMCNSTHAPTQEPNRIVVAREQ